MSNMCYEPPIHVKPPGNKVRYIPGKVDIRLSNNKPVSSILHDIIINGHRPYSIQYIDIAHNFTLEQKF